MASVANLRDVSGGIDLKPGCVMKSSLLFRTSLIAEATREDATFIINHLKCKTYIDLRTPGSVPDSLDSHIYAYFSPSPVKGGAHQQVRQAGQPRRVSAGIGVSFSSPRNGMSIYPKDENGEDVPFDLMTPQQHQDFLSDYMILSLQLNGKIICKAMKVLAQLENYPIMFGCMTGKDRTGLISCLTLTVLGATREQIMHDYLLSNLAADHNGQIMEQTMEKARVMISSGRLLEGMLVTESMIVDAPDRRKQDLRGSIGMRVHKNTMSRVLEWLELEHGGGLAYLESIGFAAEDQALLRDILLLSSRKSSL